MVKQADNECMGTLLIILFIVLVGPAAVVWGADSRKDDAGWFGAKEDR
jgi:hypothetical protein